MVLRASKKRAHFHSFRIRNVAKNLFSSFSRSVIASEGVFPPDMSIP
jgi:hypothetical protein